MLLWQVTGAMLSERRSQSNPKRRTKQRVDTSRVDNSYHYYCLDCSYLRLQQLSALFNHKESRVIRQLSALFNHKESRVIRQLSALFNHKESRVIRQLSALFNHKESRVITIRQLSALFNHKKSRVIRQLVVLTILQS